MRWPVKGKIISEYGAKPNGLRNEGINIAVPEGTGVRAAESGVVAYAGNELKGYDKLVLIRHEGGWVTAYAHAKELIVNAATSSSVAMSLPRPARPVPFPARNCTLKFAKVQPPWTP